MPNGVGSSLTCDGMPGQPATKPVGRKGMLCIAELPDHFDRPHDVVVQLFEVLCRYPPFSMSAGTDGVDLIPIDESLSDFKAGHIPSAGIADTPLLGNLRGILLARDRVKIG